VEPVRYSAGSGLLRLISAPMAEGGTTIVGRILRTAWEVVRKPLNALHLLVTARWPERTTILLVMQTVESMIRLRRGRSLLTGFRHGLVSEQSADLPVPSEIPGAKALAREYARRTRGFPAAAASDSLLRIPLTAHPLGGVPFGKDAEEGVIGLNCEAHGHPGLYIIDGSIMPANPGINPSLTITALAEYAMSQVPPRQT
ncbi:MAG: GMC family oxidoreductase, partial [Anaerolineae bacterium]|nr:GMC family oxidoreductase [Anaerolineae bacterium]